MEWLGTSKRIVIDVLCGSDNISTIIEITSTATYPNSQQGAISVPIQIIKSSRQASCYQTGSILSRGITASWLAVSYLEASLFPIIEIIGSFVGATIGL